MRERLLLRPRLGAQVSGVYFSQDFRVYQDQTSGPTLKLLGECRKKLDVTFSTTVQQSTKQLSSSGPGPFKGDICFAYNSKPTNSVFFQELVIEVNMNLLLLHVASSN